MGQGLSTVLRTVVAIGTARLLGASDRGVYAVFFSQVGIVASFLSLGFSQATIYEISRGRPRSEVLGANLVLIFGAGLGLAGFLLLGGGDWLLLGSPELSALLWVSTMVILGDQLGYSLLLGEQAFGLYRQNLVLQASAGLVAAGLLLVTPRTATVAVSMRVVGEAGVLLLLVMSLKRRFGSLAPRINRTQLTQQFVFGIRSFAPSVVNTLHSRIHLLILAAIAGDGAAGVFSVALLFSELVSFGPNAVGTVLLPRFSADQDNCEAGHIAAAVTRTVLAFGLVVAAAAALAMPLLVSVLFGEQYAGAVAPARLVVLGAALATPVQILTRYFTSRARQDLYGVMVVSGVVVASTLTPLLVPRFGVEGGAGAFALSMSAATIMGLLLFSSVTSTSIWESVIPRSRDFRDALAAAVQSAPRDS